MAATERVVVLMSLAKKQALNAKAASAGQLSAGEPVCRAVEAYDGEAAAEAAELRGLLGVLAEAHAETLRRLDATERKLDTTLAYLQGRSE